MPTSRSIRSGSRVPRAVFRSDGSVAAVGGAIINGRPGRLGRAGLYLNHSEWISGTAPRVHELPDDGHRLPPRRHRTRAFPRDRTTARTRSSPMPFATRRANLVRSGDSDRAHARTARRARVLVAADRCRTTALLTRRALKRPERSSTVPRCSGTVSAPLDRLYRDAEAGDGGQGLKLFPWLVAGETARIVGFLRARRESQRRRSSCGRRA